MSDGRDNNGYPNYTATYVQEDPTQTSSSDSLSVYDDIVRYKERWQMQDAYDSYSPNGSTCIPGYRFIGDTSQSPLQVGISGVAVGDVNCDGIPDVIVYGGGENWWETTSIYVIYGTTNNVASPIQPTQLNGTNGFALTFDGVVGTVSGTNGITVADINGDGCGDIIFSNNNARYTSEGVYVVFGRSTSAWKSVLNLGNAPANRDLSVTPLAGGTDGFLILDPFNNGPYGSVTSIAVGDINGDGITDLFIGADDGYVYPTEYGAAWVLFGGKDAVGNHWPATVDLTTLNGTTGLNGTGGFKMTKPVGDGPNLFLGFTAAVGDFNGDGIADVAIGWDDGCNGHGTSVDILFGSKTAWPLGTNSVNLDSQMDGIHGQQLACLTGDNWYGLSLAAADLNGDGNADLIIGQPLADTAGWSGPNFGTIFWGKKAGWAATAINFNGPGLGSPQPPGTTILTGATNEDGSAGQVIATGDVNGDGVSDLIITDQGFGAGVTWVIFGAGGTWPASFNVNSLNGINGVQLNGVAAGDGAGSSLAIGDVNADGINDIVIDAENSSPGGISNAGTVYVVYGHKATWTSNLWTSPYPLSNIP